MAGLPMDPFMLFSVLNTKLRDQYSSLSALCEDIDVDEKEILAKMQAAGFEYDKELNCFR